MGKRRVKMRSRDIDSPEQPSLGRCQLIQEYLHQKTGRTRSRRQISSHLQQLALVYKNDVNSGLSPWQFFDCTTKHNFFVVKRLIYGSNPRTSEALLPADRDATPTQGEASSFSMNDTPSYSIHHARFSISKCSSSDCRHTGGRTALCVWSGAVDVGAYDC